MQVILVRITLIYVVSTSLLIYFGVRFLIGKEKVNYLGNDKPKIRMLVGALFLILAFLYSQPFIFDLVTDNKKEEVFHIEEIGKPSPRNFIYKTIYTKEREVLSLWFEEFNLKEDEVYLLSYYGKTRIIINAEKIGE